MREPIIAANWKMNQDVDQALRFVEDLAPRIADHSGVEVVLAPPFTALASLKPVVAGTGIQLAAQNLHPEASGAFTGEISVSMLIDVGCSYAIVGHSERRALFGETSEFVARKARAAQDGGLCPIVCVGETLAEREGGHTFDVLGTQLDESLATLDPEQASQLVLAYEPVWAIGTGRTSTPAGGQASSGRHANRRRAPRSGEPRTSGRQSVEIGRLYHRVPCTTQRPPLMFIAQQNQHIRVDARHGGSLAPLLADVLVPQLGMGGDELAHHADARIVVEHLDIHAA